VRIQIRIQEAQKHAGPADPDPDPQHWFLANTINLKWRKKIFNNNVSFENLTSNMKSPIGCFEKKILISRTFSKNGRTFWCYWLETYA
jgi:hypothetical protein